MRDHKPQGFFYLDHRTVDGKYGIITDTFITPGNVSDQTPYIDRLDHQVQTFGFEIEAVGVDAGYATHMIAKQLLDREIYAVVGYRRFKNGSKRIPKSKFTYVAEIDVYACPMGCILAYSTTDRQAVRHYKSNPSDCAVCPLRNECFSAKSRSREVTRHVWTNLLESIKKNSKTKTGKRLYRLRRETVERSFADAKHLHAFRYARYRGQESVQEQAYLTAASQNLKKMVLLLKKRAEEPS